MALLFEIRWIDDFPTDLLPTAETRVCDKCGAWTWWASPRQKKKGRCWDCIPGVAFWRCTPEHSVRVLKLLLAAFPGGTLTECPRPRYRPDVFTVGPEVGPCVGCRRKIRRYGLDAHLFCLDCRPLAEGEFEDCEPLSRREPGC